MKLKIIGFVVVMALVTLAVSGCITAEYNGYIVVKVSSTVDSLIEIYAKDGKAVTKEQIPPGTVSTRLVVVVKADDEEKREKQCNDIVVGALGNTGTTAQKTVKVCREKTTEVSLTLE